MGNTPIHLALKLRRLECCHILLDKCPDLVLRLRDREGWTSIMIARSCLAFGQDNEKEKNRHFFTKMLLLRRLQGLHGFQSRVPELVKVMKENIPDFEMKLNFKFSSMIPFLGSVLPKDTIVIRKRGVRLRIDMTLVGFEGLRWQRGKLSFIFEGDNKEEPGRVRVLDHEAKTEGDALHALKRPTEDKINEIVDNMLLSKVITVTGLNFREIRFKPVKKASKVARFFGASSEPTLEEDVGCWLRTKVYKISDLKLKIKYRPRPLADRSMLREFLSRQIAQRSHSTSTFPSDTFASDSDEAEEKEEEKAVEEEGESTQATISAIKALVKAGEVTLGSPTNASSPTRHRFSSTASTPESVPCVISRNKDDYTVVNVCILFLTLHISLTYSISLLFLQKCFYFQVPRREEITIPIHLQEGDVLKWEFATSSHNIDFEVKFHSIEKTNWSVVAIKSRIDSHKMLQNGSHVASTSGTLALIFGNTFSRFRSKDVYYRVQINRKGKSSMETINAISSEGEMISFSDYFGSSAADLDKTCRATDYIFPTSDVTKNTDQNCTLKLWMSDTFPLSVKHITPIIEVLAKTSRHLESLKEFFDSKMPPGTPGQV